MHSLRTQSFDCGDRRALQIRHGHHARTDRLASNMNRAASAQRGAAPEPGAGETELVAQIPEKRRVGLSVKPMRFAVDRQLDHAGLHLPPKGGARPRLRPARRWLPVGSKMSRSLILSN